MLQITQWDMATKELRLTFINKRCPMSLYDLVKSILAATPYYQANGHMMPKSGAQSDSSDRA